MTLPIQNNRNHDKGLVLSLAGAAITTSYTYTTVTVPPAAGALTPNGACVQYSGQARNIALYVYLETIAMSTITNVVVDIEAAYGNYALTLADTVAGTSQVVDLTLTKNWVQVLSQVHQGTGPIDVDSSITFPAAPQSGMVLVTCNRLAEIDAKHVRIGVRANASGSSNEGGLSDTIRVFMVAW